MCCEKTTIEEIAHLVKAAQDRATEKTTEDVYGIYIYFQAYEEQGGGGHPHYGLHCDLSCGGTPEAEQALRGELPNMLFHLAEPENLDDWDEQERLEDALWNLG